MFVPSPARGFTRLAPVLSAALLFLYGCSDSPLPVEPGPRPEKPNALLTPVVMVTNTDDAGPGSLRQVLDEAPDGAIVQFDAAIAGKTIVLSTGEIRIDQNVTIEGPIPAGMRISGGLMSRVFTVTTTGEAIFRNVSIVDGFDKFAGGLLVEGTATLDHSLVANNETFAASGGGIFVQVDGQLSLVNSTVSGNASAGNGGGIGASLNANISIRNSTIAFNTGLEAGGVHATSGSFSMRNSIIAHNEATDLTGADNPNCLFDSDVVVMYAGRSLSNDITCGTASAALIVATNTRLHALGDNGGPTKTHAHGFGFAVDRGLDCTEVTDQRYVSRNQGLSCDIGAFEFDRYGTITMTVNPNAAVDPRTGVMTVTGTIQCSANVSVSVMAQASQTQKTTGKFTTIVQGSGFSQPVPCSATRASWSATATPFAGRFTPGSATATAISTDHTTEFPTANVTQAVKAFQVK